LKEGNLHDEFDQIISFCSFCLWFDSTFSKNIVKNINE